MPVSMLLCEGDLGSPDARLLRIILSGLSLEIKPSAGKYGMGNRIKARREVNGTGAVFGLLDGDFRADWQPPQGKPVLWNGHDDNVAIHFGWRWERKEIENYLIDPQIVTTLLGAALPDHQAYRQAVEAARDTLSFYQAARWALSMHRPRFMPLSNEFPPLAVQNLAACVDAVTAADHCRDQIRLCVQSFRAAKNVDEQTVIDEFDARLLADCSAGGQRHTHYLSAFAGKDLLHHFTPFLRQNGFRSADAFVDKVLVAASQYAGDLANLLPEWIALREMIRAA